MTPEKEAIFQNEFPTWFAELHGDPTKTCLAWGLECDDGWFDLIYKLCKDIKPLAPPDFRVEQVKEKFGTLRFYVSGATDEIYKIIEQAEDESAQVCEVCGSRKNVTTEGPGWISTLCEECRNERRT